MMTLGWPWPILRQGQIWSLMLLYGKKVKQWIFQKLLSSMIWNWQQVTEVTRSFCWHQNFVPWGAVCSYPGAIYMYLIMKKKNGIKSDFKEISLKLVANDRSDKRFLLTSKFCLPLTSSYIHLLNDEKMCNLQQMGKVIRPSCWHQNFVPWGLSVPAPGLYTCIKSWRKLYKIRLQRHFFETCNKWMKWQDISVDIKILSPGGCLSQPLGYIHV